MVIRVARSAQRKNGHVRAYLTAQTRSGARPKGPQPEARRATVEAEC